MPTIRSRDALRQSSAAMFTLLAGLVCGSLPALAQASGGIAGSWSGSGRVVLSTGNAERARCRVSFRRQTARTYGMSATCATPSTRVSQVAQVQLVSASSYEGRFYNREYDVTGTVRLVVNGRRMSAYLRGGGAAASLSLSR